MDHEKARTVRNCGAIVVAGGAGLRMGSNVPKQFLRIAGKPVMWWTLQRLAGSGLFSELVLVLPQGWLSRADELLEGLSIEARVAEGGARRQISVHNGLLQIDSDVEIVVVHDAVRPFVTSETLEAVIEAAARHGAATAAMPAKETVAISTDGDFISEIPERSIIWHVQTPQAFRRELLMRAHTENLDARSYATDDSMLVLRGGLKPAIVHGGEENIKITSPMDLAIAEALASGTLKPGGGEV